MKYILEQNFVKNLEIEIKQIEIKQEFLNISENLLKNIPSIKEAGKIYTEKDIILEENPKGKIKRENKLVKYKNLSLFDLVRPILMPSIDFDLETDLSFPCRLFNYQITGIKFLITNKSALLADQMGTGKTVMATTALRILFIKGQVKKALIVVPSNLLYVWEEHIKKWAPELQYIVINETKNIREILYNIKSHIFLVSYDTLKNDYITKRNILKRFSEDLDIIILDEAHNIKNSETLKSKAVKFTSKNATYKWALTGTPIQNNLKEFVSLYEFLNPDEKLSINKETIKETIQKIMLRRLKKDVLSELPEKLPPEIEYFDLSLKQRLEYESILSKEKDRIFQIAKEYRESKNYNFILKQNLITALQKLRQICNFPSDSIKSPKSDRLLEILEELLENQEKVIIFTNFINNGVEKISKNLEKKFGKDIYVSYTGKMSKEEKNKSVIRFKEDNKCFFFVATINAAGEGLTLTEASYVIFFDLHWNPAKIWQAEDRAHRIGQKNKVNIYNFITKQTVEEKIFQKLEEKKNLISQVVDDIEYKDEDIQLEELLTLLDIKDLTG